MIIVGGGVENDQVKSFSNIPPIADFVPFGIVAVNLVAIGKRVSASKISVVVPSQRHFPFTSGDNLTGTFSLAVVCVATAIIGCENVMLNSGTKSTFPSGENLVTSSSCDIVFLIIGVGCGSSAGNLSGMMLPAFGGFILSERILNVVFSTVSKGIFGNLFRIAFVSVSLKSEVSAGFVGSVFVGFVLLSLTRNCKPFAWFCGKTSAVWLFIGRAKKLSHVT